MLHYNAQTREALKPRNARSLERLTAAGWTFGGFERPAAGAGPVVWLVVGALNGACVQAAAGDETTAWARAIAMAARHRPADVATA